MASAKDILSMRFIPEPIGGGACDLAGVVRSDAVFAAWTSKSSRHAGRSLWLIFPTPIGIGSHFFFIAFVSDFICSILLVLGFGTRWAAAYCFANIFVAWAFVQSSHSGVKERRAIMARSWCFSSGVYWPSSLLVPERHPLTDCLRDNPNRVG